MWQTLSDAPGIRIERFGMTYGTGHLLSHFQA